MFSSMVASCAVGRLCPTVNLPGHLASGRDAWHHQRRPDLRTARSEVTL